MCHVFLLPTVPDFPKDCPSASRYQEANEASPPGPTNSLTIVTAEPRCLCWTWSCLGDPVTKKDEWGGGATTSISENRGGIITLNNSQLAGFTHPPSRARQMNFLCRPGGGGETTTPVQSMYCTPPPPHLLLHTQTSTCMNEHTCRVNARGVFA